jgi:hypothetical protein
MKLNPNIVMKGIRVHKKASEVYRDVLFRYPDANTTWDGSVPIEYRRTGVFARNEDDEAEILNVAYDAMRPGKRDAWLQEQEEFWSKSNKPVTQPFFEALKDSEWKCGRCELPPNPNPARRYQDLKEFGYTLATDINRYCKNCGRNGTQLIMLRLPRGTAAGYETWSPKLRERIIRGFGKRDVYEERSADNLLPDHKFPEIRWGPGARADNPDDMTAEQIGQKFQLLSNQRNEQKREVCRTCFQQGERAFPFGIRFFYKGGPTWPKGVPSSGKEAEAGCVGCGWYDLARWRQALNELIAKP